MTIQEKQEDFIREFNELGNWFMQMEYLLAAAGEMKAMSEDLKTKDRLIPGCQSFVWFEPGLRDGKMDIQLDSDALIIKGILAVILYLTDGEDPGKVASAKIDFFQRTPLREQMTSDRAAGIASVIARVQAAAAEYAALNGC